MTLDEFNKTVKYALNYAHIKFAAAGLSPTTGEDEAYNICVDLFLGKERPWLGAKDARHRQALIYTCIKRRIENAARNQITLGEQVNTRAVAIDEAPHGEYTEDGDEVNIESSLLTDGGRGADLTRNYEDPTPEPDYVYLTRIQEMKLHSQGKKVCRSLKKTMCQFESMQVLRLSKRQFGKILTFFKRHFALCYKAYGQHSGKLQRTRFQKNREYQVRGH